MIQLKIRERSLKYASIKKAKRKNTEAELEADISHHERKLERNVLSNEEKEKIINELTSKKQVFEEINRHKTKGCIIRSRTRWYNEGEKNGKYFLNLEKRHCKSNTIGQLKTADEKTLSSDKEILTECKQFYAKLYETGILDTSEVNDNYFFTAENQTKLTPEQSEMCEGELTEKECLEALRIENENRQELMEFQRTFIKCFGKTKYYIKAMNCAYK